jgi:hypothetical protein
VIVGVLAAVGAGLVRLDAVAEDAVLRSAEVSIEFASPTSCAVSAQLLVDGVADVEHRIDAPPGTAIELLGVDGALVAGPVRMVERTQALRVAVQGGTYTVRYRVEQPAARAFRCPIWLPTIPTDGQSRPVRLHVELPEGMVGTGTLPAFTWTGTRGSVTLAHVPAFVRVPYASARDASAWDTARIMDVIALAVFAGASALWVWRQRWSRRR